MTLPVVFTANGATAYNLTKSLRFRASASAYMNKTLGTPTNNKIWTWSGWVKLGVLAATGNTNGYRTFFGAGTDANTNYTRFGVAENAFWWTETGASGNNYNFFTVPVYRDQAAWYHFMVAMDTTQATNTNRAKIYINGVQMTTFSSASSGYQKTVYPTQNLNTIFNSATPHYIANAPDYPTFFFDGEMAEVNFIDGQQLTPSSFGSTNPATGVWQPAKYTGTYGTNGFYLPFTNITSTTTLGYDFSGNGNNWTTNNFSLTAGTAIRTFSTVGTTSWTAPTGVTSVNYLVVAGGGGGAGYGGDNVGGGGGGAGGMLTGTLSVTAGTSYTVTVGDGGGPSTNGSNSVFASITATGGGKGGAPAAGNGGSGGGAGAATGSGAAIGTGTAGQGNNGGLGSGDWGTTVTRGGGGGGAGGVGGAASGSAGGTGGAGSASSISGTSVTYATGGAGAIGNAVNGGTSGAANTGNGGQGRGGQGGGSAGSGGSGIVIISYASGGGATYDSMTDVPTLTDASTANYATLNPAWYTNSRAVYSNGNLKYTATDFLSTVSTIQPSSGKWYYEVIAGNQYTAVGIANQTFLTSADAGITAFIGYANTYSYYGNDGKFYNGTSASSVIATYTTNDLIGVAVDLDAGKIWFAKNGTWLNSGDPAGGTNPAISGLPASSYTLSVSGYTAGATINYGQQGFTYTPPTGFKALNTYNLPTPTIAAGNKYMDATIYTGDGTDQRAITNAGGFKPDLLWGKTRSIANDHILTDSVRGVTKILNTNNSNSEATNSTAFESFNSNGFNVGSSINWYVNYPVNTTFVTWQWQAGQGTTSSNTSGSITSTVSVNASAGFSIVTWTGTGSAATIGHGLGVAPSMIIAKPRNLAYSWPVFHTSLGATSRVYMDSSAANSPSATVWNNTLPTSSVFSVNGSETNPNTGTMVAYCWAEIAGFSKFGSYTGNGSADGPFVYTGFQPKWIMIKVTNTTDNWYLIDTVRQTYNVIGPTLAPNLSNAEFSLTVADVLSNGFKIRNSGSVLNGNGNTVIYAAFASYPFKYSNAF